MSWLKRVTGNPAARQILFAAPFLVTGASLLVFVLARISLLASILTLGSAALLAGGWIWRKSTGPVRESFRWRMKAGLLSGFAATAAYDISRFILVKLGDYSFWPFDIFKRFGIALTGASKMSFGVEMVGFSFHLMNGLGFAVAYAICLGTRGVVAGMVWAMTLETLMVSIYPGWLHLKALDEFLQVSIFGHLVYGGVLGFTCKRLLHRAPSRRSLSCA